MGAWGTATAGHRCRGDGQMCVIAALHPRHTPPAGRPLLTGSSGATDAALQAATGPRPVCSRPLAWPIEPAPSPFCLFAFLPFALLPFCVYHAHAHAHGVLPFKAVVLPLGSVVFHGPYKGRTTNSGCASIP